MSAYDKLQNEGGEGYVDYATRYPKEPSESELQTMIATAHAEAEAEFVATWTADVTAARRSAWNAEAAKGMPEGLIYKKLGFSMRDLKKAVAIHSN